MKNPTPVEEALQLLKIFEDTLDFVARRGGIAANVARSLNERSRAVRARLSPAPTPTLTPSTTLTPKRKGKAR